MKFDIQKYLYYGIIGITSLICVVFIPMIGTDPMLELKLPQTTTGWVVYITTRTVVAIINVILFHCFMEQAKVNVKDNENFKKANEILSETKEKEYVPRSRKQWLRKQYFGKGLSIFVCTMFSAFAFTQAFLTFDYMSALTYLFTIIMGIIFGILQMKSAESYWTIEYYDYAIQFKKEQNYDNIT